MKKFSLALVLVLGYSPAAFADNVAACEIILLEEIEDQEMEGSAQVASYRPAADFIASVYDEEDGFMKEIDGLPIRGVMCVRSNVIPTIRDYPIVATGLQFSLSQDFESTTSGLMTIYKKDGVYLHQYSGPDLTDEQTLALDDALETYNLQAEK